MALVLRKSGFGAVAILCALACRAAQAADCAAVPKDKIALQLYDMVALTQPKDGASAQDALAATFDAIRRTGFRNVERFGGTLGLPERDYLAAAGGLRFIGNHDPLDAKGWDGVLNQAKRFGQQ